MSKWMLWMLLTLLTGSPLLSLGLMLVFVFVADHFTWQLLPSPVRLVKRFQRAGHLAGVILTNPHERRARHELADIRVEQKRYAEAVDILKPNLEAGDEDVDTLYLLGVAYLGAGDAQRGELLLDEAEKLDADFKLGAIHLERGRFRLKRGDVKGAVEALERFCAVRQGSVEGRFLLAQALEKAGRADEAKRMRELAWADYVVAPRFQRRRERKWAWRARPSRPLMYAAALAVVLATVGAVVSRMDLAPRSRGYGRYTEPPPSASGLEEDTGE
jgi:tetratricopeptide (TPR) repeat protein